MNHISIILVIFLSIIFINLTYAKKPTVNVNYIFSTNNIEAQKYNNKKQANNEIKILNKYFINTEKKSIFKFNLKKYIDHESFKKMSCEIYEELNKPKKIDINEIKFLFKKCFPHTNGTEVYIFIYDEFNDNLGYESKNSFGFYNNRKPFILLDWERLNYNIQAALPHEMGHAFGLRHICVKGSKFKDATNLMASKGGCDGSGGQRNIGFNDQQIKIIKDYYQKLKSN